MSQPDVPWWMRATIYQIYPRSFADSNGDGIGDLRGIIGKVDYLAELGISAVWLSPIYRSPQADNGYDIADYYDIDPVYGTLDDFDELLTVLHAHGIRLIMDNAQQIGKPRIGGKAGSDRDNIEKTADEVF